MTQSQTTPLSRPTQYPCPEHYAALEQLGDEITELSAHLDAGTYQLLVLIGQFDKHGGWHGTGIQSCAHWLNWKCGMNLGAARERVRVARALPGLPQISAAFREGRISYSKARAMTRVATAKNEDALLAVALCGTASHVEKQVRLYRQHQRIEALEKENQRHTQRQLTWYADNDGCWVFKGRFTPEQGALIQLALQSAMDQLYQEHKHVPASVSAETTCQQPLDQAVPEPLASRRADALERLADSYLSGADKSGCGGERYMLNIHTDIDTLKEQGDGAECTLEECPLEERTAGNGGHSSASHVSAETSRRLSCDCSVVHWLEKPHGEPLNIGRKTRSIPPAIRRALHRRDGGCRFPGCSCTRFVDAHHVVHWADGGVTAMDNLVLLCRRHHRMVHEEGFGLGLSAGKAGEFRFTLPNGKPIPECPEIRFRGNVEAIKSRTQQRGIRITANTPIPQWFGEQMDAQIVVAGLIRRE